MGRRGPNPALHAPLAVEFVGTDVHTGVGIAVVVRLPTPPCRAGGVS